MKVFKFFTFFPFLAFLRRGFSRPGVGELPLVFIVKKASEDFIFPLFFEREKSFAPQFLKYSSKEGSG